MSYGDSEHAAAGRGHEDFMKRAPLGRFLCGCAKTSTGWPYACPTHSPAEPERTTAAPRPTEWIGPIPCASTKGCEPSWHTADVMAASRPRWGGYLPCRAADGGWEADGSTTRLQFFDGAWYVQRPDGAARCRRAVVIACDALHAGAVIPPGVTSEETERAREIHASGAHAWRWAATDAGQASIGASDVWREAPASSDLGW